MKLIRSFIVLLLVIISSEGFSQNNEGTKVRIDTEYGPIVIRLYDDTPLHRDNFIKLVKDGFYDDLLFHRVIKNFMIQGGDPNSRGADKGEMLGLGGPGYTIPSEFSDKHYHKKGALAAARKGDAVNPKKESSGSQFYIVQGQKFSIEQLNAFVSMGRHEMFTTQQIEDYTSLGGAPHLDGEYTVFGEVIEGLDVIDQIASVAVDSYNRPLEDISYSISIVK